MKVKYLLSVIGVLIVIILIGGGYFYFQIQNSQKPAKPNTVDEIKKIVAEVGKIMELPSGEDPTVATVVDVEKLKDQPFFQKAKNGNKVLIYTNAKKAILYDPDLKKVLDVAPINIGSGSAQPAQVKIALTNGTNTIGLTSKIEASLGKSISNFSVISKENAQKQNYDKTVVVLINDSAKSTAESIAKTFGASLGDLPSGEIKPKDADILVILGKDAI